MPRRLNSRTPLVLCAWVSLFACTSAEEFGCPEGTRLVGLSPPIGVRQYCLDAQDQTHGPWVYWWGPKKPQRQGYYLEGARHGIFRSYYRNGQLQAEGEYVDDHREGQHREWFVDGTLKEDAYFKNGINHGRRLVYRTDGTLDLEVIYYAGRIVGWTAHDATGKPLPKAPKTPQKKEAASDSPEN